MIPRTIGGTINPINETGPTNDTAIAANPATKTNAKNLIRPGLPPNAKACDSLKLTNEMERPSKKEPLTVNR